MVGGSTLNYQSSLCVHVFNGILSRTKYSFWCTTPIRVLSRKNFNPLVPLSSKLDLELPIRQNGYTFIPCKPFFPVGLVSVLYFRVLYRPLVTPLIDRLNYPYYLLVSRYHIEFLRPFTVLVFSSPSPTSLGRSIRWKVVKKSWEKSRGTSMYRKLTTRSVTRSLIYTNRRKGNLVPVHNDVTPVVFRQRVDLSSRH